MLLYIGCGGCGEVGGGASTVFAKYGGVDGDGNGCVGGGLDGGDINGVGVAAGSVTMGFKEAHRSLCWGG